MVPPPIPKKPEENPTKIPKNASPTNIYANFNYKMVDCTRCALNKRFKEDFKRSELFAFLSKELIVLFA